MEDSTKSNEIHRKYTFQVSRRIIVRLFYMHHFFRVCAWCHRVGDNDTWITLEEFLSREFNAQSTHGICPDCVEKLKSAVETSYDDKIHITVNNNHPGEYNGA